MLQTPDSSTRTQAWAKVELSGSSARLVVGGDWLISNTRTGVEEITSKIPEGVKEFSVEADGLGKYDSSLICLLLRCYEICEERKMAFSPDKLPDGPKQLLRLAVAVPSNEGAKRGASRGGVFKTVGQDTLELYASFKEQVSFIGEFTLTILKLLVGKARYRMSDFWVLIQRAGPDAFAIVSLISFLVGLILAFVGAVQLAKYGSEIYVADLVGIAMVREMGAIMVGVVMAGRTGAAFAAELGSMKVNEEIDAFSTFGINPMEFLVMPRVIALICMFPLLTIFADLMGILGGLVIGMGLFDLNWDQYMTRTMASLTMLQCSTGVVKSVVFGIVVAMIGCLRGMKCGNSASAVGLATTSSVVTSIVFIVVIDALFAVAFNIFDI